jgi:hypothetical protein
MNSGSVNGGSRAQWAEAHVYQYIFNAMESQVAFVAEFLDFFPVYYDDVP